jgi:hypothetical protein
MLKQRLKLQQHNSAPTRDRSFDTYQSTSTLVFVVFLLPAEDVE